MTLTNKNLIGRFVKGMESGKCNRMAIEHVEESRYGEGWTFLWGYGWALYAARRKSDGAIWIYDGWYGHSQTTSTHMNELKGRAKARYGEARTEGEGVRVAVHGDSTEIMNTPAEGHVLTIVDDAPERDYGKLDADGRPELKNIDDRHVKGPNGAGN